MTKPSKLKDILDRLATDAGRWVLYEQDGQVAKGAGIPEPEFDSSDAEAAIKTLLLELVGYPENEGAVGDGKIMYNRGRNDLRAELRAKIEGL